jgi:hypothetical protein
MIIQKCYSLYEDGEKKKDLEPLDVKLTLGKNSKGQLVIHLSTGKHKYLNVKWGMSCGKCQCLVVCDEMDDYLMTGDDYELYQAIHYWFIPENEDEERLIYGRGLVIPLKYEYNVAIVPWPDIDIDTSFEYKEEEIDDPMGFTPR